MLNGTPIKERLLEEMQHHADARGRVSISPEALGKRFGLNGHDLAKNLDQLKREGLIEDPWQGERLGRLRIRKGAMNEALLGRRKPVLTTADRIRQYLVDHPPEANGWNEIGPHDLATQLALPRQRVAETVSHAAKAGWLELYKENGRILAMRLATGAMPTPQLVPERQLVALPPTPELDRYVAARRIARLAPENNPYLEVQFVPNPIAEEALTLLAALRLAVEEPETT